MECKFTAFEKFHQHKKAPLPAAGRFHLSIAFF